jgi:hypothetical protein
MLVSLLVSLGLSLPPTAKLSTVYCHEWEQKTVTYFSTHGYNLGKYTESTRKIVLIVAIKPGIGSVNRPHGFAYAYYNDTYPLAFEPYVNLLTSGFTPLDKKECYDEHGEPWTVEEWVLGNSTESI